MIPSQGQRRFSAGSRFYSQISWSCKSTSADIFCFPSALRRTVISERLRGARGGISSPESNLGCFQPPASFDAAAGVTWWGDLENMIYGSGISAAGATTAAVGAAAVTGTSMVGWMIVGSVVLVVAVVGSFRLFAVTRKK